MFHKSDSTFAGWVTTATGDAQPYRYQSTLAENGLPDVLRVPTGTGKTLAATLPWLYRRMAHPDPEVRRTTPRWLVIVLPQRALVEQTVTVIEGWLGELQLDMPVHVLMGGEERGDGDWKMHPERERIFVGTLDMVLSRLLMRGFAEFRSAWPMSFGLLNAGVQFVFDEVQLMGPGLPTSLQLQGLREVMGTALECRAMWMSATLNPAELRTADFPRNRELSVVELDEQDRAGPLRTRLTATRTVQRLALSEVDADRYPRALAERIAAHHRPGTRTLVVLNTVQRATAVFDELVKLGPPAELVLLHSRFRPDDRKEQTQQAQKPPGGTGSVVVATQVLEAGIDLTSDSLITEVAPWSSIVQRAGRCNRDGLANDARLLWSVPPAALPYESAELDHTASVLARLEGRPVTSEELANAATELLRPMYPVLRRRDLIGLFDTTPDPSGNDVDVSPFIRYGVDRNVFVVWRKLPAEQMDGRAPGRKELCSAPISDIRDMINADRTRARVFDQRSGRWEPARPEDVRPTAVIVLDAARGGYLPDRGFTPSSTTPVEPVDPPEQVPDAIDTDPQSVLPNGRWVPLPEHLADVERECRTLLDALRPDLTPAQREAIALAGRYHDIGKAHPTFVASLKQADSSAPDNGGPWAKSPGRAPLRHNPPHFRHELVSALLLIDDSTGLLEGVAEPDLVTYLVLAHHGKVRLTIRARPDEPPGTVLGVVDGSSTVDTMLPVVGLLTARPISLHATQLSQGAPVSGDVSYSNDRHSRASPSLTSRTLRLRDRDDLGPFRLAFCEAVVRSADWRASASYETTPP